MEIPSISNVSTFSQQSPQQVGVSDPNGQTSVVFQAISLAEIRLDSTLQVREKTSAARVRQYAAHMKDGIELPPITVFHNHQSFWLGDGKHRVLAAQANGCDTVRAEVRQGTERDAFLYALAINAAHGWSLSSKERRAAVDLMLQDAEWGTWGDREIARQCGTSHPTVAKRRKLRSGKSYQIGEAGLRKYKRGDQTFVMDITRIGNRGPSTDRSEAMMEADSTGENAQTVEPGTVEGVEGSRRPGDIALPASDLQSGHDQRWEIKAARDDSEGPLAESPKVNAQHHHVDPEPGGWDCGGQPALIIPPAIALPETQTFKTSLPALHHLLDRVEGGLSGFRLQYDCDEPVIEEVLVSLEEVLQSAQQRLNAHSQAMEHDRVDLDVEETNTSDQPDRLCEHVPQVPAGEITAEDQVKNSLSSADDLEWGTIEPLQYRHDEMQPSNRLTPKQAAELAGISLEAFEKYEQHGTGPRKLLPSHYYKDDVLTWSEGKRQSESRRRHGQPMPDFTSAIDNSVKEGELQGLARPLQAPMDELALDTGETPNQKPKRQAPNADVGAKATANTQRIPVLQFDAEPSAPKYPSLADRPAEAIAAQQARLIETILKNPIEW